MGRKFYRTKFGNLGVYERNGKLVVRGRLRQSLANNKRKAFGETIGEVGREEEAYQAICKMIADISAGSYLPPSDPVRKRRQWQRDLPRLGWPEFFERYIEDTRKRRGSRTATRYANHLAHVLAYIEQPEVQQGYPLVLHADRSFALELRQFLLRRQVSRNGHANTARVPMTESGVRGALQTLKAAIDWGTRGDVGLLPGRMVNPVTRELLGSKPQKNPLRKIEHPLDERIRMVQVADRYQLTHLVPRFVLPVRSEDLTGLLIHEVDFAARLLTFESRYGGVDHSKARTEFILPYPPQLDPLLRAAIDGRRGGPVFRRRAVFEGSEVPAIRVDSPQEMRQAVEAALAGADDEELAGPGDRKAISRRTIQQAGGVTTDQLAKEFRKLQQAAGIDNPASFNQLRHTVSTEMFRRSMPFLEGRYLTGHTVRDIMSVYVGLDIDEIRGHLTRYWELTRPLLEAISERAAEWGLTESGEKSIRLPVTLTAG